MGDGCNMEGIPTEAASLCGPLGPGQADCPVRRQPHLDRRRHEHRVHGGRDGALRGAGVADRPEVRQEHRPSMPSRKALAEAKAVTDKPDAVTEGMPAPVLGAW